MASRISRASQSRVALLDKLGSKSSQAPPPNSLAVRIAVWAFSCSWRASAAPSGCSAMPQLAPRRISRLTMKGSAKTSWMRPIRRSRCARELIGAAAARTRRPPCGPPGRWCARARGGARRRPNRLVAGLLAESVVDILEAIEVDQDQGELTALALARRALGQHHREHRPIGQLGERVKKASFSMKSAVLRSSVTSPTIVMPPCTSPWPACSGSIRTCAQRSSGQSSGATGPSNSTVSPASTRAMFAWQSAGWLASEEPTRASRGRRARAAAAALTSRTTRSAS